MHHFMGQIFQNMGHQIWVLGIYRGFAVSLDPMDLNLISEASTLSANLQRLLPPPLREKCDLYHDELNKKNTQILLAWWSDPEHC